MEKLLEIWPDIKAIAADLNRPYSTVAAWGQVGRRIPAKNFATIIAAAKARGHELSFEDLHAASDTRNNVARS